MQINILGHTAIREALRQEGKRRELSHCLLFTGQENLGKRQVALWLAKNYITDQWEGPDRIDPDWRHADLIFIEPSGASIKKRDAQELLIALSKKPYEARGKVAIFDDFHTATPEAQNALLKTLEDPPEKTLIILITHDDQALLQTVRSRARTFRFQPLAEEDLLEALTGHRDHGEAAVRRAIHRGQNRPGRVLYYLEHDGDQGVRLVLNRWLSRLHQNRLSQAYPVAKEIQEAKGDFGIILSDMALWFRDLMWLKCQAGEDQVINREGLEALRAQAPLITEARLGQMQEAIIDAGEQLKYNVNEQLVWETLLLNIQEAFYDHRNRSKI